MMMNALKWKGNVDRSGRVSAGWGRCESGCYPVGRAEAIYDNAILRRVRATIVLQWKSNIYYNFLVCIRSLRYPACNAHAPNYILYIYIYIYIYI